MRQFWGKTDGATWLGLFLNLQILMGSKPKPYTMADSLLGIATFKPRHGEFWDMVGFQTK